MLRILSGKFKNTPFKFLNKSVKPTSMLVKTIIFDWIGGNILNKSCLDLFSGLGTLGFESISRGAYKVVFVEKNYNLYKFLLNFKKKINNSNIIIYNMLAEEYIRKYKFEKFDIIFLDLPYNSFKLLYNFIKKCIPLMKKKSLIYIESSMNLFLLLNYFEFKLVLKNFNCIGKINFFLFEFN